MGRLFWKLFLVIALVQMVTVVAVGYAIVMGGQYALHEIGPPPPDGLGPRLPPPDGPPHDAPHDALHAPPPGEPPGAHRPPGPPAFDREPGHPDRRMMVPPQPIIGGLVASALTAALLAWFLSKPIRSLRNAFNAAAAGNLDVRITGKMGRGKDELTDLGREFDSMVERLQALIVGQRRLLHDVSHELRSPLARMQAAIGLLSQQPENARESIARIERESVRMDRLIGELLALARLQGGFTGTMNEDVDVRELLAGLLDDAAFEARSRKRTVSADLATDAMVRGNAELLRRALENVVRNAIKYSHEGGRIDVRAAVTGGSSLGVTVSDAGPGVAAADLAAIFEPFYRAANGNGADGHGLGLAIAKRIIEAHGGSIRATNRAGGGLQVAITLPVRAT